MVNFKIEIMFDEEDYSFSDDEDYVFLGENFMVIFCVKYFIWYFVFYIGFICLFLYGIIKREWVCVCLWKSMIFMLCWCK